ncbi:methyltransferase domain-containing protein [Alicyclobacillus fructus]|uniref:methyltransferase domain-containing protein n=1 Tax=Alicyclobacillus fructus TaxID=2816082 RepID=UPI002E27F860|nr:methyltransferase domain-containing protein [Alicyclobacillus fructus]
MHDEILKILCDPTTHDALEWIISPQHQHLYNSHTHTAYPIRDGIPSFLESEVSGLNEKYRKLYDRIAPFYNLSNKVSFFLRHGGEASYRKQLLSELEIADGDSVVEISCGTGSNLLYLSQQYRDLVLYGLDISWGMLKICQRVLHRNRIQAKLIHGQAEALPFRDDSFDVVFHVGGINFFSDQRKAIQEMIRVSKPGKKIVIVDETEKKVKGTYEKTPFVRRAYQHRSSPVSIPIDFVPSNMEEIQIKEFDNGLMYCLSFRKPLSKCF